MEKSLIAIVGPTAAGKTELAIAIAKKFRTEIISADSRQVFAELEIGVSRPSEKQLSEVNHHFIASHSVMNDYAAGEFERGALERLNKIFKKHNVAVMVGGSGLYIRAVCEGLDNVPKGEGKIRAQLEIELNEKGLEHLQKELKNVDPVYFKSADKKNPRRIMRALEVFRASGKPFSSFHRSKKKKRDFQIIKIGLTMEREKLYQRINARVDEMMAKGLLQEALALSPLAERNIPALQTVGYTELFDYLASKTDLETAVNLIRQNTRNYAKRQLTWFRKDKEVRWFTHGQQNEIIRYIENRLKSSN